MENGARWTASERAAVTDWNSKSGKYSLLFDHAYQRMAEQRFDLGRSYTSLTIKFDMYIPDGNESYGGLTYDRYNTDGSSSNNKFLRIWDSNPYSGNPEKIGASTSPSAANGIAQHYTEWNSGDGMNWQGQDTAKQGVITVQDKGQWVNFEAYYKHATASNDDGVVKFYKNGELLYERNTVNNYHAGGDHAWSQGYLLGARNGATPEGYSLYLLIDNVEIWAGESLKISPPSPPQSLSTVLK